jgi:DnaA family protein
VKQLALEVRLRAGAVFASFVPGENGELIAALRLPVPGPVWLWGNPGCGKTHLLQAVCAAAGEAAAYFDLGGSSVAPPEVLRGFEAVSVLCLDDVGAVAGSAAWEQSLFRLFNDAAELKTRVICAANASPLSINWRLPDLKSRAAACAVYQLRELDEPGRVLAMTLRAAQRGLQLPTETAQYLLKRMPRDLRSLLETLDELDEASLIAQRRLTIPFIRDALERHARTRP